MAGRGTRRAGSPSPLPGGAAGGADPGDPVPAAGCQLSGLAGLHRPWAWRRPERRLPGPRAGGTQPRAELRPPRRRPRPPEHGHQPTDPCRSGRPDRCSHRRHANVRADRSTPNPPIAAGHRQIADSRPVDGLSALQEAVAPLPGPWAHSSGAAEVADALQVDVGDAVTGKAVAFDVTGDDEERPVASASQQPMVVRELLDVHIGPCGDVRPEGGDAKDDDERGAPLRLTREDEAEVTGHPVVSHGGAVGCLAEVDLCALNVDLQTKTQLPDKGP